jgi:hypothetical protein
MRKLGCLVLGLVNGFGLITFNDIVKVARRATVTFNLELNLATALLSV